MSTQNPDYCVRITGLDDYGKSKLDYFISMTEPYPVIVITSDLLSTGVDCKMTKLIICLKVWQLSSRLSEVVYSKKPLTRK